ncbi:phosphotransferase [Streptomyces massasporeus]|uniref:phosphotransferase n=1 Tax=Streptomyces massasporeus TaxID=67324 RepID=UPI00365AF180
MTDRLHEIFEVEDHDVHTVCTAYDLGDPVAWASCGGGLVNSNYRLDTAKGAFLLRCYPAERRKEEVTFELSLLTHLDETGFFGPTPVRAASGEYIGTLRGRLFSVLTFVEGDTVTQAELTSDLAAQVGEKYAHFRRVVQGFRPLGEREDADHPAVSALIGPLLDDITADHPDEARLIKAAWNDVEERFRSVDEDRLQVVHGDLFYENVIVRDGRLLTFIDYDDAYLGLPLLDLALVVMEFATPEDNRLDPGLAGAVLRAYVAASEEPPATPEELLDALVFLCCKFMAYTLPLNLQRGESIADNDYLRRLALLRDDAVRRELERAFAAELTGEGA